MNFILAQVMGGIALVLVALSYFTKEKKKIFYNINNSQYFLWCFFYFQYGACRWHKFSHLHDKNCSVFLVWKKGTGSTYICSGFLLLCFYSGWRNIFQRLLWPYNYCRSNTFYHCHVHERYADGKIFYDFTKCCSYHLFYYQSGIHFSPTWFFRGFGYSRLYNSISYR